MTHTDRRQAARTIYSSATRLALGVGLVLLGGAVAMIGNAAMAGVAVILGALAALAGVVLLISGIHRMADNIDQGMRALVERG